MPARTGRSTGARPSPTAPAPSFGSTGLPDFSGIRPRPLPKQWSSEIPHGSRPTEPKPAEAASSHQRPHAARSSRNSPRRPSRGRPHTPPLGVEELHALVAGGEIDTVVLAFPDMQGRLQGKRFAARFFLDEVLRHGTEGCSYLLAADADMNTVDGYAMFPDLDTLRRVPWNEGTALVVADLAWADGSPVVAAPRQMLRRQLERLAGLGYTAQVGTELEFIVFRDTYEQVWDADYRGLTPANQYNVDYSVLGTGRIESLLRRIRNEMASAGLTVESAKGECNPGQHEIAFRYDEALVTCDQHAVYKTGAKEIAAAVAFLASDDSSFVNATDFLVDGGIAGAYVTPL
ncbi:hypothetical protein GCM10027073_18890 [Streptomyces chlorus]